MRYANQRGTESLEKTVINTFALHVMPNGKPFPTDLACALPWFKSFEESTEEGLWDLASTSIVSDDSVRFWRSVGRTFLTQLADQQHLPALLDRSDLIPSEAWLTEVIANRPVCEGSEYITLENLQNLWADMVQTLRNQLLKQENPHNVTQWLESKKGSFGLLGKVCLHLAENKRSETQPFAFMATVALSIHEEGRVIYTPLGKALEEADLTGESQKIVHLLSPLVEAGKQVSWLAKAIEEKEIYGPQSWTAKEAYVFLKSLPTLQELGIRVRVPNWWQAPSSQVKAQVVIHPSQSSTLGGAAMLHFDVSLALGQDSLSPEELEEILSSTESFMRLRGQWVEIDSEKIKQTLSHWNRASRAVQKDGLTWHQGMRLLSGSQGLREKGSSLSTDTLANPVPEWTQIIAGSGIQSILSNMLSPQASQNYHPGTLLKAQLRPYQEKGVAWLGLLSELGLGACLADDMGLGKTIQVLALLLCYQSQKKSRDVKMRSLLVVPASLLANWLLEARKFAPSLQVCVDHAAFKKEGDFESAEMVITTYGTVARLDKYTKEHWNLVILDEAQAIKNPNTAQTLAVKSLRSKARIALTGTPIENRLTDLWSLFDFLNPGLLSTHEEFQKFVNAKSASPRLGPLRTLTQPYILRRLKTDRTLIEDLPDKTETLAWCAMTKRQVQLYSKSVEEFKKDLEASDGVKRRGIVLSYLLRFKQICNHPTLALGTGSFDPQSSGKSLRLLEIAEEISSRQEKLLIFTQYREMCPVLTEWLRSVFHREGLVLDGSTPVSKRRDLVEEFQDKQGPPFFVLSLKAGGTGLTLTAANHVIHFDRWWNPAVENQATDRAFRLGQKRNVLVHKFVCKGTLEEKIDEMIESKKGLSDGVLGGGQELPLTELSNDELLKMVSLDLHSLEVET